ncbi:MAG: hypothetical protein SGARI_004919 [Bacillariaceae sp.]
MNEAITLNNKAAFLLEDGGHDVNAVRMLERALNIGRDETAAMVSLRESLKIGLSPQNLSPISSSSSIHRSFDIGNMVDESFFLVNQVLEIRLPSDLTSETLLLDDDLLQTCCSIIIFNLAIAYHRRGHVRRQGDLLVKSKRLYLLAFKLLRQVHFAPNSRSFVAFGSTIFHLGAACLNNVAHISQSRVIAGHSEANDTTLDSLSSLLDTCPTSLWQTICTMQPGIVMGLHLNLYRHYAKGHNAAPAA